MLHVHVLCTCVMYMCNVQVYMYRCNVYTYICVHVHVLCTCVMYMCNVQVYMYTCNVYTYICYMFMSYVHVSFTCVMCRYTCIRVMCIHIYVCTFVSHIQIYMYMYVMLCWLTLQANAPSTLS